MSNVIDLNKDKPHYAITGYCVSCGYKWIGVMPYDANILEIECADCTELDTIITFLPDQYLQDNMTNG